LATAGEEISASRKWLSERSRQQQAE